MFSLPKSISELPDINNGMMNAKYEQVSASRDITESNWANGAQSFKFEVSGTKHWVPSKSYLRMRMQYVSKTNAGVPISPVDGEYTAAPFTLGNMFQSCEFRIADQTVCKLGQYVGAVSAFKDRITKSGIYLETIGNAMNGSSVNLESRYQLIEGLDANTPADHTVFMWQPPLAIFDQKIMPAGRFELILNPETQSQWKLNAVLTKDPKTPGTDYDVIVKDCFLYIHTIEGSENVSNTTYALDLENYNCMADKISSTDTSQKYFDVSPSTVALAVAYQDVRSSTVSNMSSSLFHVFPAIPAGIEWGLGDEERKINNFYISYAGQQKPSPNFDAPGTLANYTLVQRYVENQLENGLLHSDASPESYEQFLTRGLYMLFNFPKSGEDQSTRVQVSQSFKNADFSNMRLLLFSISRTSAEITVTNGSVSNILLKER